VLVGTVSTVRSGRVGQQALRVGMCDNSVARKSVTGSRLCDLCSEHGGFPLQ